ncbi:hypothetical protein K458DRAFT_181204 [Lentithecium fluviatile CBS 122367]|uniref:Uncharacterized protein n=1 Tax=Lentithecium fluviatile CBS 122367 TaxID=1168545 RepID=A0A6G1IEX2_9PLEO|nr:hypothetical protein K458DRAFT_181204 [Lentithecium fluviatile CBS 122367]
MKSSASTEVWIPFTKGSVKRFLSQFEREPRYPQLYVYARIITSIGSLVPSILRVLRIYTKLFR